MGAVMSRLAFSLAAGAALSVALSQLAVAADMPVKARPLPLIVSWTGFYIGGEVGGGWGHEVGTTLFTTGLASAGSQTPGDISGMVGGVEVGFNYQVTPSLVVGIAGEWLWSNVDGSTSKPSNVAGIFLNGSTSVQSYSTVTGRIGYAVGDWLIYGKGGAAFSRADYNANATTAAGAVLQNATTRISRSGWTIGAGVEHSLVTISPNLSVKLEYAYLDFGTDRVLFNFAGVGTNGADVDTHVHMLKAGINYLIRP